MDERGITTPSEPAYASLTQAERHARAALFTEEDIEEARQSVAEKRPGVTLHSFRKMVRDYANNRQ